MSQKGERNATANTLYDFARMYAHITFHSVKIKSKKCLYYLEGVARAKPDLTVSCIYWHNIFFLIVAVFRCCGFFFYHRHHQTTTTPCTRSLLDACVARHNLIAPAPAGFWFVLRSLLSIGPLSVYSAHRVDLRIHFV